MSIPEIILGALNNRIRGFQAGCDLNMHGGSMTDALVQGLVEMANGCFIRGIRAMLKK